MTIKTTEANDIYLNNVLKDIDQNRQNVYGNDKGE